MPMTENMLVSTASPVPTCSKFVQARHLSGRLPQKEIEASGNDLRPTGTSDCSNCVHAIILQEKWGDKQRNEKKREKSSSGQVCLLGLAGCCINCGEETPKTFWRVNLALGQGWAKFQLQAQGHWTGSATRVLPCSACVSLDMSAALISAEKAQTLHVPTSSCPNLTHEAECT